MSLRVDLSILNQKGTPAFYSDTFANRPAFGFAGRVFISTDTGAIYEDNGSAWTLIADAGAGTTGTLQQVTTNGNTTTNAIGIGSTLSVGTTTIPSGFSNTKFYAGLVNPAETHTYEIGVTGTATANNSNTSIWGIGVYGAGFTNGATRSAGVQGDGEVTASSDTGSAIGVRGYANATHAGGLNIAILGDASGSSTGNYGIYTNMAAATNTYANYHLGTALNYFGGYIGVGTNVVNSPLHIVYNNTNTVPNLINPAIIIRNFNSTNGVLNGMIFSNSGDYASAAIYTIQTQTGNTGDNLVLNTKTTGVTWNTGIIYTTNGNCLIGTTSDNGNKLQVSGIVSINNNTRGLILNRDAVTNYNGIGFQTATLQKWFIGLRENLSSNNLIIYNENTTHDTITINTSNDNVSIYTLGTGLVYSNGGVLTSTNPSDSRLKNEIADLNYGLNDILKLRPVSYIWKNDKINQGKQFGFIAQEVQEIMPDAIKEFGEDIKYLGLEKDAIYAALINAIKELNNKIDNLKN
jgi:hypothetical protein